MISLTLSPVSFSAPGAALTQPVLPRRTGRSHLRRWFTRGQAETDPRWEGSVNPSPEREWGQTGELSTEPSSSLTLGPQIALVCPTLPSWQGCRLSKVPFKDNLALPVCPAGRTWTPAAPAAAQGRLATPACFPETLAAQVLPRLPWDPAKKQKPGLWER